MERGRACGERLMSDKEGGDKSEIYAIGHREAIALIQYLPAIMRIEKKNIFEELRMDEYIWGSAFVFTIEDSDLSLESNRFSILNKICKSENWNELGDSWYPKSFEQCSELLLDSIEFDMAYSEARITPKEKAKEFHNNLLKGFTKNNSCCYSNWVNNHWKSRENGSSWNSLTENTFDLSTVFIKQNQILITCFRSED